MCHNVEEPVNVRLLFAMSAPGGRRRRDNNAIGQFRSGGGIRSVIVMKKKGICKLTSAVLMMAMIVSLLLIPGIPAQCATAKLTKLSADKVYTNFDLTGDGKKDRFKIQRTKEKEKGQ